MRTGNFKPRDKVRVMQIVPGTTLELGQTGEVCNADNNGFIAFDYAVRMDHDSKTYLLNEEEIERYYTPFRS